MALKHVKALVQIPLQQVESRLGNIVASVEDDATRRWITYFSERSGNRLRPLLTFLVYRAFAPLDGEASTELVDLAVCLELMHSASLIHDDVIDEEVIRRNQTTLHKLTGNRGAVLLGNVFYLKAFNLAHEFAMPCFFSDMTQTAIEMCYGEVIQSENRGQLLNQEDYLKIVSYKTAALIALVCRSAARLAKASEADVERTDRIGRILGVLYQLRDDMNDHDIALQPQVSVRAIALDLHIEFEQLFKQLTLLPETSAPLLALEQMISQDFLVDP